MNYGEELAYWYFRLNGFFPLLGFVLHERPGRRPSDCDVLAVRPPYADEPVGGAAEVDSWLSEMTQDHRTMAVICEVKTGEWNPETVLPPASIREAVRRIGLDSDPQTVASALIDAPSAETSNGDVILKIVIAAQRYARQGPYRLVSLEHVNAFICERMRAHSEKHRDRHFFHSSLLQYIIHFGSIYDRPREPDLVAETVPICPKASPL